MRVSLNNVGGLLAVVAGCTSLLLAVWPGSAPQSQSLNFWLPLAIVAGCGFLVAAFIADRYKWLARAILLIGGLGLVGSAIYFGYVVGGGPRSVFATLADLIPGLLALVASFVIGPIRRHAIP